MRIIKRNNIILSIYQNDSQKLRHLPRGVSLQKREQRFEFFQKGIHQ